MFTDYPDIVDVELLAEMLSIGKTFRLCPATVRQNQGFQTGKMLESQQESSGRVCSALHGEKGY